MTAEARNQRVPMESIDAMVDSKSRIQIVKKKNLKDFKFSDLKARASRLDTCRETRRLRGKEPFEGAVQRTRTSFKKR
jgi:hypothetical protein